MRVIFILCSLRVFQNFMTLNSYVKEINTHTHTHIYIYTHTHIYIYIYIYIYMCVCVCVYGTFEIFLGSLYFWEIHNSTIMLPFYFKTVPLFKYPLPPATVNMLETFLEAILLKPFQFLRRILNNVSSFTKAPSLPPMLLFSWGNK